MPQRGLASNFLGKQGILEASMFELRFQALRGRKAQQENRTITLKEIAETTGLSIKTIRKIAQGETTGLKLETLEALCIYFNVASIAELIEFKP